MIIKGFRHVPSRVAVIAIIGSFFLFNGFNSIPVYAASDISVSNSGKVSFGKVSASSTGTLATGEDTLSIATDCEAGANVYATSVNGSSTGTSLINLAAKEQDESSNGGTGVNPASYTINTSSATIGSASALANNTWGLNTNVMEAGNGSFYGLPEYSASGLPTVIYSGTNTELPIYYGAKVTNSLAPGTYTGEVLYTVTVNNSCLDYTVKFNKNANDASGDMSDQSILPTGGTLNENSFTYSGYAFLGWSLDPAGKTGTAENGIGTAEDVDFADKASFPGSNEGIIPGSDTTLYAIWSQLTMQSWAEGPNWGCSKLRTNEIISLTDARDNHVYKVKKLPDGKCWMIQNLTLTATDLATEGKALTNANTNIPADDNNVYYIPPQGKSYGTADSINNQNVTSATTGANFNSSSSYKKLYSHYPQVGYKDKNSTDNATGNPVPEDTAYYNFYTATLGFSYYDDTVSYGSSPRDICPKGWRLPKTTDSGTNVTTTDTANDFTNLTYTYNPNASWSGTATGSYSYGYFTSDATIRQNMIKGDASSLDPELDTNGSAGFTYAGLYNNAILSSAGMIGAYWSSSIYDANSSYYLSLNGSTAIYPQNRSDKYYGLAVRCVAQHSNATGYMQDYNPNNLASGESAILVDKRDGSEYTVKKIGSGDEAEVWMTSNLKLGYDKKGHTLTKDDTNILDYNTYYIPPAGRRGPVTDPSTLNSTNYTSFDSNYKNEAQIQYNSNQDSGYYDYVAASLGYSGYAYGAYAVSDTPRDICPAGWQLPKGSDTTTKSWVSLNKLLGGTGDNRYDTLTRDRYLSDASFKYTGYYYNSNLYDVDSYGHWWSATVYSDTIAYSLYLGSNGYVYPKYTEFRYKSNGYAIRCVAKDGKYTINYNANGGTGEMAPSKGYIGGSALSKNTFTREGYHFYGWSTNPNAILPTYDDNAVLTVDLAPADGSATLYAIWTNVEPIMQTANICDHIPEGHTLILKDSRDNQEYPVYHIPSNAVYPETSTIANVAGKCFMTKDLNLGAVDSVSGSASSIIANGTMSISPQDSTFTTPTGSGESITVPTGETTIREHLGNGWDTNNSYSNRQYTTRGSTSGDQYAGRGYYTWGAAMLVCPKGWHLPTSDEYDNSYTVGTTTYKSTAGISRLMTSTLTPPWSFEFGGSASWSFNNAGSGSYWSSTQIASSSANSLELSWNETDNESKNKYIGFAVRCITD